VVERVRPFYCGSQYTDWTDANCCRCRRQPADWEDYSVPLACPIMAALSAAACDDGRVDADIARRMGYTGEPVCNIWQCAEFEVMDAAIEQARRGGA
jgi:hypothetical protein